MLLIGGKFDYTYEMSCDTDHVKSFNNLKASYI